MIISLCAPLCGETEKTEGDSECESAGEGD